MVTFTGIALPMEFGLSYKQIANFNNCSSRLLTRPRHRRQLQRARARVRARASGPPPGPLAAHDPWPIPGPAAGAPRPAFPLVNVLNFGTHLGCDLGRGHLLFWVYSGTTKLQ